MGDKTQAILAYIVVGGTFGIFGIAMLSKHSIPDANMIITSAVGLAGYALGFYFGSAKHQTELKNKDGSSLTITTTPDQPLPSITTAPPEGVEKEREKP